MPLFRLWHPHFFKSEELLDLASGNSKTILEAAPGMLEAAPGMLDAAPGMAPQHC